MDGIATEQTAKPLPRCVLIVEDNGLLAMNMQEMLHELGIEEILLGTSVAETLPFLDAGGIDFAILDFDLGRETSAPIAERLRVARVPFIFASGYGDGVSLPPELIGSPILQKPYMMRDIEAAIASV